MLSEFPINVADLVILALLLISGLLALSRGFVKEVLSIAGWVAAALAALTWFPLLQPIIEGYVEQALIAGGIAFAAAIPGVEDFRVRLSWDFVGEGSVLGHPGVPSAQAWDAEPLDDADRVVLDLSYVPTSAASRARRDRQLHEDRRPVWTAGWRRD